MHLDHSAGDVNAGRLAATGTAKLQKLCEPDLRTVVYCEHAVRILHDVLSWRCLRVAVTELELYMKLIPTHLVGTQPIIIRAFRLQHSSQYGNPRCTKNVSPTRL